MAYKLITQDTRDEWTRLHSQGLSASAIARQYEVRQETVSKSLKGLAKPVGRPRKYADRAAADKARYAIHREALIEKGKAYYRRNREARLAYQAGQNKMVRERAAEIEQDILKVFAAIPEGAREDYAHWLLFLAGKDRYTAQAVSGFKVDNLIGAYAGV